jgi:hypothetical protein
MSAIPCPVCGHLRKIEQVTDGKVWMNPQCFNCGDPGWSNPIDADDPFAGRESVPVSDWTDDEWMRALREFPPNADYMKVERKVAEWRHQVH